MVKKKVIISVVVPVYNEIGNIQQFHLQALDALSKTKQPYEIIYIDDFSTDGTFEWLQSVSIEPTVQVIRKSGVKGKAFSLIQGFQAAKGDVFVMIDGDLQYPPERIPDMVAELSEADVVVASRKDYHDGKLRKFLSSGFRTFFGKMLFGLNTDIQSGMKVFTREVYKTVHFQPTSPWTFDLEFLNRARQAGFTIKSLPITFSERKHGESKVEVVNQSLEIGMNALFIKLKRVFYLPIHPEDGSMRGAGIGHKKRKYITHTTLPVGLSALETFSFGQKLYFLGTPILLLAAFYLFPLATARTVVAVLSILYFIDAVFNVFIVMRSISSDHEVQIGADEIESLDETQLPMYTILCPLYKEAHVVPQFLEAIAKIDWPKDKLDVMFLLEEDDKATIAAFGQMVLPYYARTVIVPDSKPKTKPKACNYGLSFAKGKYLVIFDAEDIPDPLQLKKAYLGFQKVPKNVKCLQAKLSYYNSHQNLLTRFFTAEYALWFDVTLPGLQSLNSALPLGGTSNHFETENLRELQGWDPFNVTEDADLGVRLFQKGYRTAIIDSTTYEEATSVTKNWLRQRSRWLKGYMQTYLVHTRNMGTFIKQKGLWHNAIFQMTVGGKILFVLLNPIMWLITFLYFVAFPFVGPAMLAIYQPPFSYLAVISWIFGNFIFLYCYLVAIAKRKQWDIAKYVFLIPLYWFLMSTAAAIGLYELIFRPHYWQKTIHGFHLGKDRVPKEEKEVTVQPEPVVQPAFVPAVYAEVKQEVKQPRNFSVSLPTFALPQIKVFSFVMRWLPIFAVLNVDLLLARFFLSYEDAQLYFMIALVGKGIFLFSQLGSNVITALMSHRRMSKGYLYRLIFFTFLINWVGFAVFGLEGNYTVPAVFGAKFISVVPYLAYYLFGLLCFAIANRLTTFRFYKKDYTYTVISVFSVLMQVPYIYFYHDSILDFVRAFAYIGSINLLVLVIMQMSTYYHKLMQNNISSVFGLFEKEKATAWTGTGMRILIFNWRDTRHKYAGGAEVYIYELAKRWIANGNKVTLFCGNDNQNPYYEEINGIEIYRRGGTYSVYLFAVLYYFFKFAGKYDVILDCENGIPFFTPLFAREQVILLIHHVHQEIFHIFLRFPFNYIAALLEGKFMPFVYQNKSVVTVSASSQKDVFKLGFTKERNIQIIPNGVSDTLFVDYPKTENPSYIYLGRLKDYKNIDVAIKAFARVVKIKKNAMLSIVGTGETYPALTQLVADLGIEKSVTFHGRVSEREKAKLLSKSWAALQPSQMEGWGLTVIEANATGTPVIASHVNGLQDSVVDGQTGILVPPANILQFANAMMKIAEDTNLRNALSENARLWAKNFDWSRSADVFYRLIGGNFGEGVFHPSYSDVFFQTAEKGINNV